MTGAGENQEDTAIVRAIISLAHSLELTITAEGIETARQALLMQAWGCERGQGTIGLVPSMRRRSPPYWQRVDAVRVRPRRRSELASACRPRRAAPDAR